MCKPTAVWQSEGVTTVLLMMLRYFRNRVRTYSPPFITIVLCSKIHWIRCNEYTMLKRCTSQVYFVKIQFGIGKIQSGKIHPEKHLALQTPPEAFMPSYTCRFLCAFHFGHLYKFLKSSLYGRPVTVQRRRQSEIWKCHRPTDQRSVILG